MTPPEALLYWIQERMRILERKKTGQKKPWSDDPVFQATYFCNVRREDDRVTQWIRNYYSGHVDHPLFEYNILLSRFLNWPETLHEIGYRDTHEPEPVLRVLKSRAARGEKVWGGAYVITTHGIKMGKTEYLCNNVLPSAYKALEGGNRPYGTRPCVDWYNHLQRIEGVGSFLSAQIIADLKNTKGHSLQKASDWWTFAAHGPGSLRGASWFFYGKPEGITPATFPEALKKIRSYVDRGGECDCDHNDSYCTHIFSLPRICNQDLQNCLCEFDKYMRVKNGTGRSKRNYDGT